MNEITDALNTANFSPELIHKITEVLKNPPEKISINIEMNGMMAMKHQFCREILMVGCNLTENEADKYLIRSGSEREISRLVAVWNYFHDNQDQFEILNEDPDNSI